MPESDTQTLDPAAPAEASLTTTGAGSASSTTPTTPAGPSPDTPPRPLREAAKAHAADLVSGKAAPGRRRGANAFRDKAAADPATVAPNEPPPAHRAAPAEAADPVSALAAFGAGLPPEEQAAFGELMAPVQTYLDGVAQWAQQVQQATQMVTDRYERMERIAADPRFQQALKHYLGGGQGSPAGNGTGAPAAGPGGLSLDEAQAETEAERQLIRYARNQDAAMQQLQERLNRMEGTDAERTKASQQERQAQLAAGIDAAHAELDRQFPALVATPAKRQEWHDRAAELLDVQSARGRPLDVKRALLDAARLLTYDDAKSAGAQAALDDARRASRHSTYRDTAAAPDTSGPRPGESLRELAKRMPGASEFSLSR